MNRRSFLKLLPALASIPLVAKLLPKKPAASVPAQHGDKVAYLPGFHNANGDFYYSANDVVSVEVWSGAEMSPEQIAECHRHFAQKYGIPINDVRGLAPSNLADAPTVVRFG